jgi:ArsR family metal-binding transcriptional regulator
MTINIEIIQELIKDKSNNIWEKYNKKRLYLEWTKLVNLEIHRYNTGNISTAYLDGEKISNSKAYKYLQGKAYIDLNCNTLQCQNMNPEMIQKLENALS